MPIRSLPAKQIPSTSLSLLHLRHFWIQIHEVHGAIWLVKLQKYLDLKRFWEIQNFFENAFYFVVCFQNIILLLNLCLFKYNLTEHSLFYLKITWLLYVRKKYWVNPLFVLVTSTSICAFLSICKLQNSKKSPQLLTEIIKLYLQMSGICWFSPLSLSYLEQQR